MLTFSLYRYIVILFFIFCGQFVIFVDSYAELPMPRSYPSHWLSYFQQEPVFGSKIHIVETGKLNKQSIVLVHGLGQNGLNDWRQTVSALEDEFHIISFDLPGFGLSDARQGLFSPSNYSKLLHWITTHYAKGKVILVGHSLGGAISLRYAHDYPDDVKSLTLVDVAGILHHSIFTQYLARVTPKLPENFLFSLFPGVTKGIDDISAHLLSYTDAIPDLAPIIMHNDMAREYLLKDKQTANAAMALIAEDFSRAISETKVPTHIIWGERDSVTPLRTGKLLAGRMPNASLTILPGIDHVPMSESPASFNKILRMAFLLNKAGEIIVPPRAQGNLKDYRCVNEVDVVITGAYRHISIENCQRITLKNIYAESLSVLTSKAVLENVIVKSSDVALIANKAVIEGTLVRLEGKLPVKAIDSRIDLAGSSLITSAYHSYELNMSKLYFSVSDITENQLKRYVHKVVNAR